ncbi:alpha/beta hydrolase [Georgenia wangjunii]|uniref:alpha/beta hydrolase n=1 Tax=Georgenia wangjunii TaxID=3117730 RepID=UPI002F262B76
MSRTARPAALTAFVVAALLLSGCSDAEPEERSAETTRAASSAPAADLPAPPPGLEDVYAQEVAWEECGSRFDCTRVTVPLDYDEPDGEQIELALKRHVTEDADTRLGSLLVNPGGPGGSGTSFVEAVGMLFSEDLLAGYDVVGFDPRGVGESDAIDCVSDVELDEIRSAEYDLDTDAGLAEYTAATEELAASCAENTGELLAHVDTVSAARDLDVLRHVLGDPQLAYLGYSYGTLLGATYADLFPENVGRLVLDGAVDPALDSTGLVMGQAVGFENALRAFVEDCLAGDDCPLSGDVDDAVGQVQDLLAMAESTPLPTGTDRELTVSLMASGIILPLYEDAYWPLLSSALQAAMKDQDGSQLLLLADLGAERELDGSYSSNAQEAFPAINCLDYPVATDIEQMRAEAETLAELSPTFGSMLAFGDIACQTWPHPSDAERAPIAAEGAAPVVVIGTTGDPATPYEWSVSMADQLADAVLVTYEGQGHTAYGRSNDCITEAVDAYLLEGTLPPDGLTC